MCVCIYIKHKNTLSYCLLQDNVNDYKLCYLFVCSLRLAERREIPITKQHQYSYSKDQIYFIRVKQGYQHYKPLINLICLSKISQKYS